MKSGSVSQQAEQILSELKAGKFQPVYLLMGEEPYFIDLISDYIEEHALQPHEREFNQTITYGGDTDPLDLVSAVKRFPMMAERQVVILKEARQMKQIDLICEVIEKPVPTTILVVAYKEKNLDKRTRLAKAFAKNGVLLQSNRLKDYEVHNWIQHYCKKKKINITAIAAQLMADHIGSDLERVVSELDKLAIALPEQSEITPAVIEKHIGISKDFNVFELQKAISARNSTKAFQIVKHFGQNPKSHPLLGTNAVLSSYFAKLYQYQHLGNKREAASLLRIPPFALKEYDAASRNYSISKIEFIFGYLRETDLRAKGVNNHGTDDNGLLQELVFKILN